ncbi:thiamine pyrophosphate-binding protein [Vreelandella boliviensis]|uniref:Thiamine pyrophosphate enzyme N-terminal TPP-binding domain-containing protein n=1 Tax=Vreelandella boliviensis LC1 TaxID=1072583 RepID=A0A7U9GHX7_9GAMM|nr:thiamine pyrophosphate-binding protein [Halomonas boliviensis]EHJ93405.1 hypothetical protein KUC_0352 [Halomonas boliviensis LC1]
MSTNVAEIMVETLQNAGAKRCYEVVGDTLNHFTDALRQSDPEWIGVRHEEVGGFAAGGEAYLTQGLALVPAVHQLNKGGNITIFTADTGSVNVWMLRHIRSLGQRRTLASLHHGERLSPGNGNSTGLS